VKLLSLTVMSLLLTSPLTDMCTAPPSVDPHPVAETLESDTPLLLTAPPWMALMPPPKPLNASQLLNDDVLSTTIPLSVAPLDVRIEIAPPFPLLLLTSVNVPE